MLLAAFVATTMSTMSSCYKNDNETARLTPAPGVTLGTRGEAMVKNQNHFAWNMFGEVNKRAGGKNSVCSPLSMIYCLGMVNAGASGTTSSEIMSAMGFEGSGSELNNFCNNLLTQLPAQDRTTTFSIANCVEVNEPFTLLPDYVDTVKKDYDALVENRDFGDGKFGDYINGWVSDKTGGMIPKLVDEVNADAVAYVINALYFKGIWQRKFAKNVTAKKSFTKADGTTTEVDMMHQTEDFTFDTTEIYKALSMNYGNRAYSMQILLPNDGRTVDDVIAAVKALDWKSYLSRMESGEVEVSLPKFSIEYGGDMGELLRSLGIRRVFTNAAEMDKFCSRDTYVSKVAQKAKIEVDEEGTEAAAATYAEVMCTSAPPTVPLTFCADHPFVFVITERSTGLVCFVGVFAGESQARGHSVTRSRRLLRW